MGRAVKSVIETGCWFLKDHLEKEGMKKPSEGRGK